MSAKRPTNTFERAIQKSSDIARNTLKSISAKQEVPVGKRKVTKPEKRAILHQLTPEKVAQLNEKLGSGRLLDYLSGLKSVADRPRKYE